MGSTRLPGKVLKDLSGATVLERVVRRARRSVHTAETIVATTTDSRDEPIVDLCARRRWACFRGSEDDVLDRYYRAAVEQDASVVVRVTSDCPMIDPEIIDWTIAALDRSPPPDYASNVLPPRTFPRGLDVEALRFAALERAWHEDRNPDWREHVTPYVYRNPNRFRLARVAIPVDQSAHRWTLDTDADLAFLQRIYDHFGDDRFSWREALAALEAHPEWAEINRDVAQKEVP